MSRLLRLAPGVLGLGAIALASRTRDRVEDASAMVAATSPTVATTSAASALASRRATARAARQVGPIDEAKTRRARPPIRTERTTFASATTALGSEIAQDLLLAHPASLALHRDLLCEAEGVQDRPRRVRIENKRPRSEVVAQRLGVGLSSAVPKLDGSAGLGWVRAFGACRVSRPAAPGSPLRTGQGPRARV